MGVVSSELGGRRTAKGPRRKLKERRDGSLVLELGRWKKERLFGRLEGVGVSGRGGEGSGGRLGRWGRSRFRRGRRIDGVGKRRFRWRLISDVGGVVGEMMMMRRG